MPGRHVKPSDRSPYGAWMTVRQCTLEHICPPNKATDTVRATPGFPSLDRLHKVRWTRARRGPIGWRAGMVLDCLGHVPELPVPPEPCATVPHQVRVEPLTRAAAVKKRSDQTVGQRALLIHEPSALSESPACRRLYGAPTPPDHGAGWALYSAFPLREVAPSFCTATYTPAASPSD